MWELTSSYLSNSFWRNWWPRWFSSVVQPTDTRNLQTHTHTQVTSVLLCVHALTCTDVRWVEVVIGQLQRVIVAEFTQDGPGGFMTSPLDKESVQEQETYGKHMWKSEWSSLMMNIWVKCVTVECESIVLDSFTGVLPHDGLHVL